MITKIWSSLIKHIVQSLLTKTCLRALLFLISSFLLCFTVTIFKLNSLLEIGPRLDAFLFNTFSLNHMTLIVLHSAWGLSWSVFSVGFFVQCCVVCARLHLSTYSLLLVFGYFLLVFSCCGFTSCFCSFSSAQPDPRVFVKCWKYINK